MGSDSLFAFPPPYDRGICSRRNHVVVQDDEGTMRLIEPGDERLWRCDCGLMMLANGHAEIRFGLLEHLFPDAPA